VVVPLIRIVGMLPGTKRGWVGDAARPPSCRVGEEGVRLGVLPGRPLAA
jgi:hypothetical protein